jgi:hypothetical protein
MYMYIYIYTHIYIPGERCKCMHDSDGSRSSAWHTYIHTYVCTHIHIHTYVRTNIHIYLENDVHARTTVMAVGQAPGIHTYIHMYT